MASNYLTCKDLDALLLGSSTVLSDNNGPKVIQLSNQDYLKVFKLKRWFSSALFFHYADRFVSNFHKLVSLNVLTMQVNNIYVIPKDFTKHSKYSKAVQYTPLAGKTVRDLISGNNFNAWTVGFAKFIAKLHDLGIYFRAIHFANIVCCLDKHPDEAFGLIDIENMKFYNKPLSIRLRNRNFTHMLRYEIDKSWLIEHKQEFLQHYISSSLTKLDFTQLEI